MILVLIRERNAWIESISVESIPLGLFAACEREISLNKRFCNNRTNICNNRLPIIDCKT